MQKAGHVDDDVQISALDAFYEKDGRRSRYIGEVLERHRGEDAGDLNRSELDELDENWTCLNAPGRKIWKIKLKILMDEKSWKTWKSNQKIVMDEELVQNVVMDEELVRNVVMDEKIVENLVMNAKIDPKGVRDLFIYKVGGRNILQPSNRKLLIRIPSRDSFLVTQYLERHSVSSDRHMKNLMPLREGLHEMMQCYRRQHFAASNDRG